MVDTADSKFPLLPVVYKHYEDDNLEDCVSSVAAILDHDPSLDRHNAIQLLALLANSVEDDADTLCYIFEAEKLYKVARASQLPHEIASLDKLGEVLDQVMTLVYERPDPEDPELWDVGTDESEVVESSSSVGSSTDELDVGEGGGEGGSDPI